MADQNQPNRPSFLETEEGRRIQNQTNAEGWQDRTVDGEESLGAVVIGGDEGTRKRALAQLGITIEDDGQGGKKVVENPEAAKCADLAAYLRMHKAGNYFDSIQTRNLLHAYRDMDMGLSLYDFDGMKPYQYFIGSSVGLSFNGVYPSRFEECRKVNYVICFKDKENNLVIMPYDPDKVVNISHNTNGLDNEMEKLGFVKLHGSEKQSTILPAFARYFYNKEQTEKKVSPDF